MSQANKHKTQAPKMATIMPIKRSDFRAQYQALNRAMQILFTPESIDQVKELAEQLEKSESGA